MSLNYTYFGGFDWTGMLRVRQVATPAAPTLALVGQTGSTTYTYKVTATVDGRETAASTGTSTTTGFYNLSDKDYIRITWSATAGATGYKVYRTAGGPNQGLIVTVTDIGELAVDDKNLAGDSATAPTVNTTGGLLSNGISGAQTYVDDAVVALGTDGDIGTVLRSAVLNANTALTGVLVGTPVTPAVAANSMILGNITASGDFLIAANNGGNSHAYLFIDSSAQTLTLYSGAGVSALAIASTGNLTAAADLAVNGGDLTSTATTFNLLNATVTTLNLGGAATTVGIGAAASATTWTGQSVTITGANSTNNTTLTVTNSSNAAAASHSIVDVRVGGTTSTGDAQYRATVPSGTSWAWGVDNDYGDNWTLVTGTDLSTSVLIHIEGRVTGLTNPTAFELNPLNQTVNDNASATSIGLNLSGSTVTLGGATTVTGLISYMRSGPLTITRAGATTVNKATALELTAPVEGGSVVLTNTSAVRIINTTGTPTNQHGIFVEALTAGATLNQQLTFQVGSTEPTSAVTDTVGLFGIDLAAASVLGIVAETAVVATADVPVTTKIIIRYNGVSYALLASTTLT